MPPTLIIVGGTCGSGKSTVARRLAQRLNYAFLEGDDYHSEENRCKMAKGIALNDKDRLPWLHSLAHSSINFSDLVIACSALKISYRGLLVGESGRKKSDCRVYMLKVPKGELERRLDLRPAHFVRGNLLESQLEVLELPEDDRTQTEDEPYLRVVDAGIGVEEVVDQILRDLGALAWEKSGVIDGN